MSSDFKGNCFIETKNLDGETNLKNKKIPKEFHFLNEFTDKEVYRIYNIIKKIQNKLFKIIFK